MRIAENRYIRDLRRITLARRLIELEVRTQLICDFTGLSDEAIRNFVRSYQGEEGCSVRHRGPLFRRLTSLLASPSTHSEASALAGMALVMEVIPRQGLADGRKWPLTLDFGERLCHVYGLYRGVVATGDVSMTHFIVLARALAEGREVELGQCRGCGGALLQERIVRTPVLCPTCKASGANSERGAESPDEDEVPNDGVGLSEERQQSLF